MSTVRVTPSNWNDPAFWAAVNLAAPGNTLDLSVLVSGYSVSVDQLRHRITLSDGATSFVVGEIGDAGADATFAAATRLAFFDGIEGGAGWDTYIFPGRFADYTVRSDDGGGMVATAPDGVQVFLGEVETVAFADSSFDVSYITDTVVLTDGAGTITQYGSDAPGTMAVG